MWPVGNFGFLYQRPLHQADCIVPVDCLETNVSKFKVTSNLTKSADNMYKVGGINCHGNNIRGKKAFFDSVFRTTIQHRKVINEISGDSKRNEAKFVYKSSNDLLRFGRLSTISKTIISTS